MLTEGFVDEKAMKNQATNQKHNKNKQTITAHKIAKTNKPKTAKKQKGKKQKEQYLVL